MTAGGSSRADAASGADARWRQRAEDVVAAVASTGSKRPAALFGPGVADADAAPLHFVRASGCRLTTPGGRTFVDLTMALGAVALGYADATVTRRVATVARDGHVAGLSHVLEVEVAERLVDVIPCAERVLFLKSGAEAIAAAVRLARTYTARDTVIACGYFGWLDWASDSAGVPPGARADLIRVPFDDVPALERAVAAVAPSLAAIVLEPVVERLPSAGWVEAARRLCDRVGAALVFDEVKAGFRLRPGGYQELAGVLPDVAAFGKAMANGFPLAAVVGRADVMDAARATWVSSTLASEATALAAAAATLDRHDETDVCAALWSNGGLLRAGCVEALAASGCSGVAVAGLDPMWFLRWDDPADETAFLTAARSAGVLFKRGAYNYAALAHDAAAARAAAGAAAAGFDAVARRGEGTR